MLPDSSTEALRQAEREPPLPARSPRNVLDEEVTGAGGKPEDETNPWQPTNDNRRRVQKLKVRTNLPMDTNAALSPIYERSVVAKVYKSKQAEPGNCHAPLPEVDETSRSTANLTQHDLLQMKQSQLRHAQV